MSTEKVGLPTRAGRHLGLEPLGERDAQALDQAVCPRARKASSRIGCQACGRWGALEVHHVPRTGRARSHAGWDPVPAVPEPSTSLTPFARPSEASGGIGGQLQLRRRSTRLAAWTGRRSKTRSISCFKLPIPAHGNLTSRSGRPARPSRGRCATTLRIGPPR